MHKAEVAILGTVQLSDVSCQNTMIVLKGGQKVAGRKEKMQRKKDTSVV